MTLTLPTYVPTGFDGTKTDFLKCKVDRSGAVRNHAFSTAITAAAASDVLIGLVPFQKGARIAGLPIINTTDLDTDSDLTLDVGYTYYDSTLGTSDPNAFVTASTAGQAGGAITIDEVAATTFTGFVAEAAGWITLTLGTGGTSYTTGVIHGNISLCYDN